LDTSFLGLIVAASNKQNISFRRDKDGTAHSSQLTAHSSQLTERDDKKGRAVENTKGSERGKRKPPEP
jgi:hypothetical protein